MTSTISKRHNILQPLALALTLAACVGAAVLRLCPLEWNFVPVGALALFAGARLRSWLAFVLPLGLMLATDALLAQQRGFPLFHAGTPFVYGSYLVSVLLGRLLARTENPAFLATAAVGTSLQFFVVTNLGVWLTSALIFSGDAHSYPATLAGLLDCFARAVPFYRGTLAGDLLFSAVLFGAHAWLTRVYFTDERVGASGSVSLQRE